MFKVNLTGTNTTVITSGPETLDGGSAYTFYALGKVGANTLVLLGTGDDVTPPAAGSTLIRIVHGASSAPAVDVYTTSPYAPLPGTPTFASVPFGVALPQTVVAAGVYQARVTPAESKTVVIDSGRLTLNGGNSTDRGRT